MYSPERNKFSRRQILKIGGTSLGSFLLPLQLNGFSKINFMQDKKKFDVIIIGGSYAGLSAALALGRALRHVLIIDSGSPCNQQTPHSHNFITQDGEKPIDISAKAKADVLKYETVIFFNGLAESGIKTENGFEITTQSGETFTAKKLIFATGVKDLLPQIPGFAACWGISVIHCPYCHGYEVKSEKTGILADGPFAFHYAQLIRNWTNDLTIFTNGTSSLDQAQIEKITQHGIGINEKEIDRLEHVNGQLKEIVFKDTSTVPIKAIYSRPPFEQNCTIPELLGCELTEQGLLKVDQFQRTNVPGIFACGDNASPLRAVANAVGSGNLVGAVVNNGMLEEDF